MWWFSSSIQKNPVEVHLEFQIVYRDIFQSEVTFFDWFRCSKHPGVSFDSRLREGTPKPFEDVELEALLGEDPWPSPKELPSVLESTRQAIFGQLHRMTVIRRKRVLDSYDLNQRDVERHLFVFK